MRKFGPIQEMTTTQVAYLLRVLGFIGDLPSRPFAASVVLRLREVGTDAVAFEDVIPTTVYTEEWGIRRLIEEGVGRTALAAMIEDEYVVIEEDDTSEASLAELDEVE